MKKRIISLTLFILTMLLLQNLFAQNLQKTERKLNRIFRKTMKKENIYNGMFQLDAKKLKYQQSWVDGTFQNGDPVQQETPFHTASLGKTFTAVATAMLVEEGKLAFDDPMHQYLPESLTAGLHVLDGKDYTKMITIGELLQHKSGLSDYFEGKPVKGDNMLTVAFEQPDKFWTPEELIAFTRERFKARAVPGTQYHYTDTEFILLGLIIEHIEQKPLHDVFRERIFEPLQLVHTSMHLRSAPLESPPTPMAELYFGTEDVSGMTSLSSDWAGGGLQSTTTDIMKFMQALFGGELLQKDTFQAMQQWTPASKGTYYGYGLMKWNLRGLFPLLPNLSIIGHSGFTGSFMYYCPELDVYITGTFNQAEFQKGAIEFLIKVLLELRYAKA